MTTLGFIIVIYCVLGFLMVQVIKYQCDNPREHKTKFK